MSKVLVLATSRKTRGGITSVIKAHEQGQQWKDFNCHWVQTHRDGAKWRKYRYLITGLLDFIFRLPFYDIVHIHVSQPSSLKRKRIFLNLAKLANKKVIIHFHAFNIEDTFGGKHSKDYISFFNKANKVIVLSNWWKNQIKEKICLSDDDIIVLYNPCPLVKTDNSIKKDNIILYAGTICQRKGYADLIKAFSRIASKYPGWKIVFAGNGEIQDGENLAKNLGIENQIEFAGWITGDEKAKLFNKSKIFCLPSYAEGFPMAALDAWAYGLPAITTPVGGIPDVAKDGENILIFSPGDIDKLAEDLERLISDEYLRSKISQASIEFAQNEFNINTINQQLGIIYSDLN